MHSPCNVSGVFVILTILSQAHIRCTIQDNQRSFLWNYVCILVQKFMNQHSEICQRHSCSAFCIVLTFCAWLRNLYWNMCAMFNWPNLIKDNICYCNSASGWEILPTRIIKIHQVIISFNNRFSKQVSYWCIIRIFIILQAQSIIVPDVYQ